MTVDLPAGSLAVFYRLLLDQECHLHAWQPSEVSWIIKKLSGYLNRLIRGMNKFYF